MAIKLTKKQAADLNALAEAYQLAAGNLRDRLDETPLIGRVKWADKSERWQDGEAGQTAQERIDLVRGWCDEIPGEGDPAVDTDQLV